jgi:hypothetical protein
VTARFVTREVHRLVSVDLLGAGGELETLTGTPVHPVWSLDRGDWVPLAELTEGETLQGHTGPAIVLHLSLHQAAQPVYNLEIHGEHVYQVGELGVLVHNAGEECELLRNAAKRLNLNSNDAVSHFGLYEIKIHGALHKIGKADLGRVTQSSGFPTRLHQQVRSLEKIFGKGSVIGKVVDDLGNVTTETAKAAEHARILENFKATGFLLIGNWKSFKL